MAAHFDNLALINYYKEHDFHSKFNRHSLVYNKSKLDLIDSLVTDETIKNTLLKYKARDFISHNHSEQEAQQMVDYYLSKSTNEEDKENMTALVASLKLLRKGNPIPNLKVLNVKNKEQHLLEIITKPTIIYFWSANLKVQYRNSHYKVEKLKQRFPEINFVSININANDDVFWRKIINKYNFPIEDEYRFMNPKKALKMLAVNYVNKAIVVGADGKILNPNVNLFKTSLEKELEKLLKN